MHLVVSFGIWPIASEALAELDDAKIYYGVALLKPLYYHIDIRI
jgi:hypothetical protein